jgi:hypothetical protein
LIIYSSQFEYVLFISLKVHTFEHVILLRYDNVRAIPCVLDGFKPSQRKVLFACFKKRLHLDMKVAQLCGYVAEHAAYHHGEASLQGTITSLAQDFCGSNNLNLLVPSGQFGNIKNSECGKLILLPNKISNSNCRNGSMDSYRTHISLFK